LAEGDFRPVEPAALGGEILVEEDRGSTETDEASSPRRE
jgi:hypothetical protein